MIEQIYARNVTERAIYVRAFVQCLSCILSVIRNQVTAKDWMQEANIHSLLNLVQPTEYTVTIAFRSICVEQYTEPWYVYITSWYYEM